MRHLPLAIFCFVYCLQSTVAEVRFTTGEIVPYQYYDKNNELVGEAIPILECVMGKLGKNYTVEVLPWVRAQKLVESKHYDAFFVASQNQARDKYAAISKPLFEGTRSWYIRPDSDFKPDDPTSMKNSFVGAVFGTNMHKWLSENYYNVITKDNEKELLHLLKVKRLDAVLLTDLMYDFVSKEMGLPVDTFNKFVAKQHPLGVYFGYHFLRENKGFLNTFNKQIDNCKS